jgi:hypothetical protein
MNRRAAIALTGAGLLASGALIREASAAPSPIRMLFEEWQQIEDEFATGKVPEDISDQEFDAMLGPLCSRQNALTREILALPIRDPADFAMKVIAATSYGQYAFGEHEDRIFADARMLIAQRA